MAGGKGGKSNQEDDAENIEKLINKVCTNFSRQLEVKIDDRFEKFDKKLSEVSNAIIALNMTVSTNSKSIIQLGEKNDFLEQNSKRNALRILGVEEQGNEYVPDTVIKFVNDKLKTNCNISDIDCAFRLGKLPNENGKPRTLLVNFVQNLKRNEILNARKQLKNMEFTIYEDLTTRRYELLQAAKKKYGNNKAWSSGGNIYIWNDKQKKKVLVKVMNDL